MAKLSDLAPVTTGALALSNLILVTPNSNIGYQPQNRETKDGVSKKLAPPLLFHYEGENSINLDSDITDHYIEDNTAIQDQVALRPEMISVTGFIGELNDVVPKALFPLKAIADKLTVLSAYTPALTTTALIAYNNAFLLYQTAANVAGSAVSSWNTINGSNSTEIVEGSNVFSNSTLIGSNGIVKQPKNQNKQQEAFGQFYGYWRARTLFTIQTPWAVFQNMAIKSLRAIQDSETRVITNFEVTFKMLRFARTLITGPDPTVDYEARAAIQASPLVDQGTQNPTPSISVTEGLAGVA